MPSIEKRSGFHGENEDIGREETSFDGADDSKDSSNISEDESAMETKTEISKAVRQRNHVAMKMLRIKQMLSKDVPSRTLAQLKVLSKTIPVVYADYSHFHYKIIALVAEDALKKEEETYANFEEIYYNVFSTVKEKLSIEDECERGAGKGNKVPLSQHRSTDNGSTNFVQTESTMQNATKAVQYMMNNWGNEEVQKALLGNDDDVVQCTTSSCQERYRDVLDVLMGSANDKRNLVETHIRGMANLRKMETDSKDELAVLLREVTRHVDSLYYLEQEVTGVTEQFVVNLISSALTDPIRQSWQKSRTFGEPRKLSEMIKFLRSQYPVRKSLAPSKPPVYKSYNKVAEREKCFQA